MFWSVICCPEAHCCCGLVNSTISVEEQALGLDIDHHRVPNRWRVRGERSTGTHTLEPVRCAWGVTLQHESDTSVVRDGAIRRNSLRELENRRQSILHYQFDIVGYLTASYLAES
jgi:hypothetical protein